MRVLATGGTGVVGDATVTALLAHGHEVRLLSRHAREDAARWPGGVDAWPGNVTDAASLRGAARGCDAVVHLAAVVREQPPDVTFAAVNVQGTRHVVDEAARSGAPRFVYVSSLGCERGTSDYHRSKLAGEEIVRGYAGPWTVVRVANVYGPGDEVLSLLLRWVRALPAVPVIGDGEEEFQPIWAEDAGEALARAVERDDLTGAVLEIAGPERTCMNDVVRRFATLTGRDPLRVPVPSFVATLATGAAARLGADFPVDEGQIRMLREGNVIDAPAVNALESVFGVRPTPLAHGLRLLADQQPEQLPDEGVGALVRKRFWVDIEGSRLGAEALLGAVRRRFDELTPWTIDVGSEPGTPRALEEGATLTMHVPLRGNVQVRVNELAPRRITLVTLQGHPLAGAGRLRTAARGARVRFEVQVVDRPASIADWLVMRPVGTHVQAATWRALLDRVLEVSGGRAPDGVQQDTEALDEREAAREEARLGKLVRTRRRVAREEAHPPEAEQPRRRPPAESRDDRRAP
ncbi:MAG TPA: NAD-dependent epimerase/dehydratase family protein [Gemmatimonadaceae bacterium]|nr:NAD-dependent epimerase/dehydratase family protein [Gemmatimonadaceae bacterium]